ncbi:hypothetical protein PCANB_000499 [Pneumocystis canis]|nr:hypothetical protein PCANB_000499 [Pneumocystis canis]
MISPLQITHILYDPQDILATLSALLALLPLAIVVIYLTLIYERREIELLLMYIGQITCQFLNTYLKQLIQQPRPDSIIAGYGMPSNHAQFISYLAGYLFMWHFYRSTLTFSLKHNSYRLLHSKLNTYLYIKDTMNEEHQLIQKEWVAWKEKQTIFDGKKRYT